MRAIEFAVVNKNLLNIQVLNLSLGHPIYERATTDPLVQAVESAVRSGLVVVVAAGNVGLNPSTHQPGYSGIVSPANSPSAFSVGAVRTHNTATRDDDQIALFSSRGPTRYDGFAKERLKELLEVPTLYTIADDPAHCAAVVNSGRLLRQVAPRSQVLADIGRLSDALLGRQRRATKTGWSLSRLFKYLVGAGSANGAGRSIG